jgi:hypothetical protein
MAFALRQPYRRRGTRGTGRVAAGRAAGGIGSLMIATARLVRLVAWIVALIIVAGIVLRLLDANMGNVIVRDIHDAASFLVGPFKNVFTPNNPKASIAANWGLAAIVYLLVGSLIAGLLVRLAPRGVLRARTAAT